MSTIKKIAITLFFISITFSGNAQFKEKIVPPSEGKTVIYFVRTTALGSLLNFRYFEKGTYLGKFNGRSYLRYECEPGEHIFWIKAENIDVLKANLEEGKTYMVETNATIGAFSASAKFKLIDFNNEKQLKRINRLFSKKKESTFTQEELAKGQKQFTPIIQKGLLSVKKKLKKKKFKVLSSDMNLNLE